MGIEKLLKKARAKYYTKTITEALLQLSDSPLYNQYENAASCCDRLMQKGNKFAPKWYCNTRICHVCNRIRTGKAINGYVNQFMKLDGLNFVTLTLPNVPDFLLKRTIKKMIKECTNIIRVLNEKQKLGISGIRKIETTYNEMRNDYHPHLHILIDKNAGEILRDEWLNRHPKANIKGQNVQKYIDANTFKELFKYTTKFESKENEIYVNALDIIFQSMYKVRTFQPFGKIKKQTEDISEMDLTSVIENVESRDIDWIWSSNDTDWVNSQIVESDKGCFTCQFNKTCKHQTDYFEIVTEHLTNFKPTKELKFYFEKTMIS